MAAEATRVGTSRVSQDKGVGHVWPGFAALTGLAAITAGNGAIALRGTPRIACLVAVALFLPLTLWLCWLTYAWHAERWPYKPPPRRPGRAISMRDHLQ